MFFDFFFVEEGIIFFDGKDEDDFIVLLVFNFYVFILVLGGEVSDEDDVIFLLGNSFYVFVLLLRDGVKFFFVFNVFKM